MQRRGVQNLDFQGANDGMAYAEIVESIAGRIRQKHVASRFIRNSSNEPHLQ